MKVVPGITVTIDWHDEDLLEVGVVAANGRFAGSIWAYGSLAVGPDFADALCGFPASPTDRRFFEIGSLDEGAAEGGARFEFMCFDGAGHAAVLVRLRAARHERYGARAEFFIEIEAAAVDEFVGELRRFGPSGSAIARLRGAV